MQMNADQQHAFTRLTTLNSAQPPLMLSGSAGTGKTHLVAKFVASRGGKVCVAAPTHKAVGVLRAKCREALREAGSVTDVKYRTVHKLLHLTDSYTDEGELEFVQGEGRYEKFDLVVVDEASMIDEKLFKMLLELKSEIQCAMLFVGDPYQLPPVVKGSKGPSALSPAFNLTTITLAQIMRTNKPDLMDAFAAYRASVQTGVRPAANPACKRVDSDNFKQAILNRQEGDIVLAYRNSTVAKYNEMIRAAIFPGVKDRFAPGERLLVDSFFTSQSCCSYSTSTELKVAAVEIKTVPAEEFGLAAVKVYVLTLNSDDTIYVVHKDSVAEWNEAVKKAAKAIMEKTGDKAEAWRAHYRAKGYYDAPVIYAYAITVHKSQGSTYKRALIDAKDIYVCTNARDAPTGRRCLYTAVTRASDSVVML